MFYYFNKENETIAFENGECYVSIRGLAKLTGTHQKTIQRHIAGDALETLEMAETRLGLRSKGDALQPETKLVPATTVTSILWDLVGSSRVDADVKDQCKRRLRVMSDVGVSRWIQLDSGWQEPTMSEHAMLSKLSWTENRQQLCDINRDISKSGKDWRALFQQSGERVFGLDWDEIKIVANQLQPGAIGDSLADKCVKSRLVSLRLIRSKALVFLIANPAASVAEAIAWAAKQIYG